MTHVSVQNGDALRDYGRAMIYRDIYQKPIVFDEVKYEGDVPTPWGQLSAEEMVFRFWEGTVAGTYVGHGETYRDPQDIIWWAKGGVLHGQSPARLAFLRNIMEDGPPEGLDPIDKSQDWPFEQDWPFVGKAGEFYLTYFGHATPTTWEFKLPMNGVTEGTKFTVEVIDTWNMTITPVSGVFEAQKVSGVICADKDGRSVPLPGKPSIALRIRRVDSTQP